MSRSELVMVREVLEGVVSPAVATSVLFEALEASGRPPPATLDEMRTFAEGPLDAALRKRLRDGDASQVRVLVGELFERALGGDGGDVDIDVDLGDDDATATAQMSVVTRPVPVVVLSATPQFAERLHACLGEDRVKSIPASDEATLSKGVFAYSALVVVIDAVAPARVDGAALAAALRRLPNGATTVIWGSETEHGHSLVETLVRGGASAITLDRGEGIEPLLDLVLSRHSGE
jgi:hypothetical protein